MKGTWQTTDSGLAVPLVVGAAVLAVAIAGPVAAAVAAVAEALVITITVLGALALAAGGALVMYRVRRGRPAAPLAVHRVAPVTRRPAVPIPAPRYPAVEARREVHLHFHGVGAAEVAAILADVNRDHG